MILGSKGQKFDASLLAVRVLNMCQWHMFSTDRSRAEMREHAVQSNPVSEGSKAFDPNIIYI